MTRMVLFVVLLVLAPLSVREVSGVWDLDMQWSGSETHATGVCTIKQDGQKLTGSCSAKSKLTGEITARNVTLQIDVEQDGNTGRMTFAGSIDEDSTTIKGACQIVGGPEGKFVMKKQKGEPLY
jgi:hypothetical protein